MLDEEQVTEAGKLFPALPLSRWEKIQPNTIIPEFTIDELNAAAERIKHKKAPEPDFVPPEVAQAAIRRENNVFLDIVNEMIWKQEFPRKWKEARLVLIPKIKKREDDIASYRPICLLSVFSKITEALIEKRLKDEIEKKGDFMKSNTVLGKKRSTIHVMEKVRKIVREATKKASQHKKVCALVTINVKNAFNSARWKGIVAENGGISRYIIETIL